MTPQTQTAFSTGNCKSETVHFSPVNDYYPFGEVLRETSANVEANKFKYQGKERDQETGYDYFEARIYDPQLGRFLQVDPMSDHPSQLGLNPYHMGRNNPVVMVDPSGMFADFYTEQGEYLGNDGVDDGKVYTTKKETVNQNTTTPETCTNETPETAGTDWMAVKADKSTEYVGQKSDLVDPNGATISNSKLEQSLVGLSIYLRNVEGVDGAKVVLNGKNSGDRTSSKIGVNDSRHLYNEAADFHVNGVSNQRLAEMTSASGLFNKVIYYPNYPASSMLYSEPNAATGAHVHGDVTPRSEKSSKTFQGWSKSKNGVVLPILVPGIKKW